jgi:hypothetical protein
MILFNHIYMGLSATMAQNMSVGARPKRLGNIPPCIFSVSRQGSRSGGQNEVSPLLGVAPSLAPGVVEEDVVDDESWPGRAGRDGRAVVAAVHQNRPFVFRAVATVSLNEE